MISNIPELTKQYELLIKLNLDKLPPNILQPKLDVLYNELSNLYRVCAQVSDTAFYEDSRLNNWEDIPGDKNYPTWTKANQIEYVTSLYRYSAKLMEAYFAFANLIVLNKGTTSED